MIEFLIIFAKYPHIGQKIFGYLDFNDLKSCRVVSKSWYGYLNKERLLWVELLEKEHDQLRSKITQAQIGSQESVEYISPKTLWKTFNSDHDEYDAYDEICSQAMADAFENHTPTEAVFESWSLLIDAVKHGPSADIISLIPKINIFFYVFGDISEAKCITKFQKEYFNLFKLILKYDANINISAYLRAAIQAENIAMVKFVVTKVDIYKRYEFEDQTYFSLVERTGNMELIRFFNSLICKDFGDDSETLY
jgi:hypothetical protein